MIPLSPTKRSELRAQAHKLSPVVIIGDKGLTDEVMAEVDRSLKAHELIKVRAATDDRDARGAWMEAICARLEAHAVQQIGKVLVIYRMNPVEPQPKPKARPRPDSRVRGSEGAARAKAGSVRGKAAPRGKLGTPRATYGTPRAKSDTPRGRFGTPRATFGTPRAKSDTPREKFGAPRTKTDDARGKFGAPRTKTDDARGKFGAPRTKADNARGKLGNTRTEPGGTEGRGDDVKRSVRPRSRTPSPLPESGPRRRRPRTSR